SGTEIRQNPFARGGFRGGAHPGAGPGAQGTAGFAFEDLSDLFGGIFSGAGRGQGPGFGAGPQRGPLQGEDARFSLEVDFLDAAKGAKKRLTLPSGKSLDVGIPAGIADGQTIRLKGQGNQGPGQAGDALIEVKVREHTLFKRDGNDIRIELPISLQEAVLGAKVEVPTVHGAVSVTIPKGANTGRILRLKGKGIAAGKTAPAGDQYVKLMVMLPPGGETELEQFVNSWGPKHPYDPRADIEKN
ncbi:MAG: J domain-containing protein, partial [Rhodospirillaceae bacterium]